MKILMTYSKQQCLKQNEVVKWLEQLDTIEVFNYFQTVIATQLIQQNNGIIGKMLFHYLHVSLLQKYFLSIE